MTRATCILAILLLLSPAAAWAAKDEPPTADEQALDYAKSFKKGYKKMTSADQIAGVDKLVAWYLNKDVTDKKSKKAIVEGLQKASIVKDKTVVTHVLKECAKLDDGVVKVVLAVLKRELAQKAPDETIYETALATLGKLHSTNKLAMKQLTDLLVNKEDTLVQLSCRAIAGYESADGNTRKELFESVLKAVEGTYSAAQGGSNQTAERKWNIIGDDAMDALQKLSHVKLQDPPKARKWFNDNKKKSWDPKKK